MAPWILLGLRWSARITGLLLVGLVAVFIVGAGPPNPFNQPPSVQIEFLALGLMVCGFLVGWRIEWLGGLLAVIGWGIHNATELAVNGKLSGGAFPLFAVPGILFLASFGARAAVMGFRTTGPQ